MTDPIVECVPNFSEGRRPEVVDEIRAAIAGTPGAVVLDQHSDPDHNRSVITFAGPPQAVEEAAFRAIERAAALIDLTRQKGEHPRIGAADVVPFVPIEGIQMADCVGMAHRLGARVGDELGLPVYLYEEAALRPERRHLEVVRRGQYEGLREVIATDPERAPDFGPRVMGPAGATVIGARPFLVAYNVNLATDDVEVARQIARAVRYSSGGLSHVKALGVSVAGRAQVTMNLTDFQRTPVHRVVELIRTEAGRHGVMVQGSELVGLIPWRALFDSACYYLGLHGLQPDQVLETRLAQALRSGGGSSFE